MLTLNLGNAENLEKIEAQTTQGLGLRETVAAETPPASV